MKDPLKILRDVLIGGTPPSNVPEGRLIVGLVPESFRLHPYTSLYEVSGVKTEGHSEEGDSTQVSEFSKRIQISTFSKTRSEAFEAGEAFSRILETANLTVTDPTWVEFRYESHVVIQDPIEEDVWQSVLDYSVVYQQSF